LVAMRMGITREGGSAQPYGRGFRSAPSLGTLTQATGWCKADRGVEDRENGRQGDRETRNDGRGPEALRGRGAC